MSMSEKVNPFTPTFGKVPLLFAGRKHVINDIVHGLEGDLGDPNRTSLFVGARGSGKTALMTQISREAEQRGWVSANVTALPGMLEDVYERTKAASAEFISADTHSRITGLNAAGVGITGELIKEPRGNWRSRMTTLLDELNTQSVGLLITVDEVDITLDELRELVATFQHFVREDREVALLLAGLPQNVSALLHDKTISFLRRAMQHRLGAIHEMHEVRETIKRTIELSGRSIDEAALEKVTDATGGYPFLIQLVGYHVWRQSPKAHEISLEDADEGIRYAVSDMNARIFDVILRELSDTDQKFLEAMLADEDESKMVDIADRMGVSASYAAQYRRRLLEQGVIGTRGHGKVGFDMPQFRDYLESGLY